MAKDEEFRPDQPEEDPSTSERRTFLKQVAAAVMVAGTGNTAFAEPEKALFPMLPIQDEGLYRLTTPLSSQRILKHEHVTDGPRQETVFDLELIGGNGVKMVTQSFMKRMDTEQEYDVVVVSTIKSYKLSTDSAPGRVVSHTSLIHGKKGPVQGDFRADEMTIITIQNGNVNRQGPLQKNVRIKNPFSGMSDQQAVEEMLNHRLNKAEPGGNK